MAEGSGSRTHLNTSIQGLTEHGRRFKDVEVPVVRVKCIANCLQELCDYSGTTDQPGIIKWQRLPLASKAMHSEMNRRGGIGADHRHGQLATLDYDIRTRSHPCQQPSEVAGGFRFRVTNPRFAG